MFDKGGDEVLAGLLAVADDVDAASGLFVDGDAQSILLALEQLISLQFPRGPKSLRLCEPRWFRQASDNGGGQKCVHD
ncbi:hypothetical protein D3C86_2145970 [compost metagenome]